MAFDQCVNPITALASTDLSARQFQFMTINSSGQVAVATDAAAADGVLLNDDANAQLKRCALASQPGTICRVMAGAAFSNGALLEASGGKAVTQASGKILAKALAAATANGDIVPALLIFQR